MVKNIIVNIKQYGFQCEVATNNYETYATMFFDHIEHSREPGTAPYCVGMIVEYDSQMNASR